MNSLGLPAAPMPVTPFFWIPFGAVAHIDKSSAGPGGQVGGARERGSLFREKH